MEWGFLTALSALKDFPAVALLAVVVIFLLTGKLLPVASAVREVNRAQVQADKAVAEARADRDARLDAKNEEIARLTLAHDAEVSRAREAEQEWRNAWRESQDIAAEVRSQNRDLIDSLYYVRKVVGALPSVKGGDTE